MLRTLLQRGFLQLRNVRFLTPQKGGKNLSEQEIHLSIMRGLEPFTEKHVLNKYTFIGTGHAWENDETENELDTESVLLNSLPASSEYAESDKQRFIVCGLGSAIDFTDSFGAPVPLLDIGKVLGLNE